MLNNHLSPALCIALISCLHACSSDDAALDAAAPLDPRIPDSGETPLDSSDVLPLDAAVDAAGIDASHDASPDDAEALEDAAHDAGDAGDAAGPESCACAEQGSWELANVAPCIFRGDQTWAFSAKVRDDGQLDCGASVEEPPTPPEPTWTTSAIELNCAGAFEVCWEIRAGSHLEPKPTDCVVTRVCTSFEYPTAGVRMTLPALPGWVSDEHECAERFFMDGGYGQATLQGTHDACGVATPEPRVFDSSNYCRPACVSTPDAPECSNCRLGIGGS